MIESEKFYANMSTPNCPVMCKIWKLALRDAGAGGNHLDGAIRTGKRGRWRALPESVMSKNIGTLEVVCTQWPQEPSNSNRDTDKWK